MTITLEISDELYTALEALLTQPTQPTGNVVMASGPGTVTAKAEMRAEYESVEVWLSQVLQQNIAARTGGRLPTATAQLKASAERAQQQYLAAITPTVTAATKAEGVKQ